jgi:hypothetical protein
MTDNGYKPELKDALRALPLPVFVLEHSATGAIAANEGCTVFYWSYASSN